MHPTAQPLVHTYSIVARDAETGEIGVAVQSHYFSVGSVVTWAEAGVGAVATQSVTDPAYGKLGLDLMRAGKSAPDTLAGLVAADSMRSSAGGDGRCQGPRRRSYRSIAIPKLDISSAKGSRCRPT